ncbi:MAG: hypothetical protein V1746_01905 [bacterium]
MKSILLACAILIAWGVAKVPWEGKMEQRLKLAQSSAMMPISGEMRDQLGQGLALAVLGGFRGLAANFLWLKVMDAWENTEWVRLRGYAEMAVTLQPRVAFFWELGGWHMAWNASISAENSTGEPNEHRRKMRARQWLEEGRNFLERGARVIPDSLDIWMKLGDLYWQRLKDYRSASKYYKKASECPGALPFVARLGGIALERAGDDRAAYDYFVEIWRSVSHHPRDPSRYWEAIADRIHFLENKLNIPKEKSAVNEKGF